MNEELPEITTGENDVSVRGIQRESALLHVKGLFMKLFMKCTIERIK